MASILDHPIISRTYFFPRKNSFEDVFWVDCGDIKLSCYYSQKHPGAKTVVLFHGNGETVPDYIIFFLPIFEKLGYNCFLAEYRGYGLSEGTPMLVKMLEDVVHIIKAINLSSEQIILFGRSVGSIYAIHAASLFPDIAGLIIESGISDIAKRLIIRIDPKEIGLTEKEFRIEIDKHLNHKDKLKKFNGCSLFLHAKGDHLIGYEHGEQLYEWANKPKQLKLFETGDHNTIFYENSRDYINVIQGFMNNL